MVHSAEDIAHMKRCFELAQNGLGNTYPNPLVGCVIVHEGRIIGEGYHKKCGEAHAEINAIASVKDKSRLSQSTLYVNLEPCSHQGRTPACSLKLIDLKIPRVVISNKDPYFEVSGRGIEMLKKSGAEVITGILEKEGAEINKRFFTFHTKKRPYIILKWAQTADGFLDKKRTSPKEKPVWITNEISRSVVHRWRTEENAIMVGYNTALLDNPALNVREWTGNQPVRIVTDKNLILPANSKLLDGTQKTLVFTVNPKHPQIKNTEFILADFSKNSVEPILNELYKRDIQSVIVEGGAKLLNSFISQNVWDEARIFTGSLKFTMGVKAPVLPEKMIVNVTELGGAGLAIYRNSSNA